MAPRFHLVPVGRCTVLMPALIWPARGVVIRSAMSGMPVVCGASRSAASERRHTKAGQVNQEGTEGCRPIPITASLTPPPDSVIVFVSHPSRSVSTGGPSALGLLLRARRDDPSVQPVPGRRRSARRQWGSENFHPRKAGMANP